MQESSKECVREAFPFTLHFPQRIVSAAAKVVVGQGNRNQPGWCEETSEELEPLIVLKNEAETRILRSISVAARKEFRWQQQRVKRAETGPKEWIRRVEGVD